ncbi:hypothetical protein [Flavilitoribacter nigricans]|uniref:Uncharacterized protein n=1 Tax=Flavilitoribacter nigricans (strain ATCC 23147 / DSM 23189 / NBRC 102662 / NCIMB 1420 / SS-2) TaxID=1122177 RepID=A0A2D0N434_FLAN2|nr:hypothetical protein [Flavilitoribacter nigricans]PHN03281.1 hypothetical protein CRP01_28215 [Flavilitoribacter nigricans DSM 23189 = NBRC 102662]
MNLIRLSITDFRQILREQLLWVMFIVAPAAQFALARWLVPELIAAFPVFDGYQVLIAGAFTVQVVSGIGFVMAMMLLDEKDDGVLSAIRVLPLGPGAFLIYRLFTATMIAVIFGFAMLYFSGLVAFSVGEAFAAALLFALICPAVVLFMSTYGDNKVEGLAMYKGVNLVLLLPIVSFFVPDGWHFALGFIPDFWSFHFTAALAGEQDIPWLFFGLGVLAHLLLIGLLYRQFRRRVFH